MNITNEILKDKDIMQQIKEDKKNKSIDFEELAKELNI